MTQPSNSLGCRDYYGFQVNSLTKLNNCPICTKSTRIINLPTSDLKPTQSALQSTISRAVCSDKNCPYPFITKSISCSKYKIKNSSWFGSEKSIQLKNTEFHKIMADPKKSEVFEKLKKSEIFQEIRQICTNATDSARLAQEERVKKLLAPRIIGNLPQFPHHVRCSSSGSSQTNTPHGPRTDNPFHFSNCTTEQQNLLKSRLQAESRVGSKKQVRNQNQIYIQNQQAQHLANINQAHIHQLHQARLHQQVLLQRQINFQQTRVHQQIRPQLPMRFPHQTKFLIRVPPQNNLTSNVPTNSKRKYSEIIDLTKSDETESPKRTPGLLEDEPKKPPEKCKKLAQK